MMLFLKKWWVMNTMDINKNWRYPMLHLPFALVSESETSGIGEKIQMIMIAIEVQ